MAKRYVPERGHAVWLHFCPQAGHEQAGRRPALVVSPKAYNDKVGLALFCPVTTKIQGYPYEVLAPRRSKLKGAILADQIKSLDWRARKAEYLCRLPATVLEEVLAKIATLIES